MRNPVGPFIRRVRTWISTAWGLLRCVLIRTGKIIRVPLDWLWRGMLVFAAVTMVAGGILQTLGQGTTSEITGNGIGLFGQISSSDTVVTIGFFIGIMAVPTWVLLGVIDRFTERLSRSQDPPDETPELDSPAMPDLPAAGPDQTKELTDEDQRNRPDQELAADHGGLPGEPAPTAGR